MELWRTDSNSVNNRKTKTMHPLERRGKRFGYPECCVADFVARMELPYFQPMSRIQRRIGEGTGFVPCSYCCWKVLSGQCELDDLIQRRREPKPFPYGGAH